MTEKRFAVTQTVLGSGIYDFQAEDTLCESYDEDAYGEVCKKLNELTEEKEICENEIARLEMIITKLKDKDYDNYTKKIQELEDEHLAWKRVDL